MDREEALTTLRSIRLGSRIKVCGTQRRNDADVAFEVVGTLHPGESGCGTEFLLHRRGAAPGVLEPFFSTGITYSSIDVLEQSQEPRRRLAAEMAAAVAADASPRAEAPPQRTAAESASQVTVPVAQAAPAAQTLPSAPQATPFSTPAAPAIQLTAATPPFVPHQPPLAAPYLGMLPHPQPFHAHHYQQLAYPPHLMYAAPHVFTPHQMATQSPAAFPAAPAVFPAAAAPNSNFADDAVRLAHLLGQANRGTNRPIWSVCPGLIVPASTDLPWRCFCPAHYVPTAAPAAGAGNWSAEYQAAKATLLPLVTLQHNDKSERQSAASLEASHRDILRLERSLDATIRTWIQAPPREKPDWYVGFYLGAKLLSTLATLKFGYYNGGTMVMANFDSMWSEGHVDVEKLWPNSFRA